MVVQHELCFAAEASVAVSYLVRAIIVLDKVGGKQNTFRMYVNSPTDVILNPNVSFHSSYPLKSSTPLNRILLQNRTISQQVTR